MANHRHFIQLSLLIGGISLIGLGIYIFVYLESLYQFVLNEALKFTPTSEAYRAWRTNDPPLDLDLYLFNWTNPEDVRNRSIKPHFEEVGPYRVKEVKEKTNLTWHDNSTISYRVKKIYYYKPQNSIRKMEDDIIRTISVVPLVIAYKSKQFNFFTKSLLSVGTAALARNSYYFTGPAKEILFDGYDDGILNILSQIPLLNVQSKFGIFYGRNDTIDYKSVFSMNFKNDHDFGKLLTWNYKNTTHFYQGHCNDVKGSAGEFYPLNINKSKLVFYSNELCRYAELEFVREETVKGVLGYRFTGDNIFDNGTTRPENRCFCGKRCFPSGLLDVSSCRDGSPIFLSFPHFHAADPYYTDLIDGMKPNKSKHEFYVVIEPNSGIVMEISATMQMNVLLESTTSMNLYKDMPTLFVPMFFFTQKIQLKDDLADILRLLQGLPYYMQYASVFFVMIGVGLMIWIVCLHFNFCVNSSDIKKNKNYTEQVPLNEKIVRT